MTETVMRFSHLISILFASLIVVVGCEQSEVPQPSNQSAVSPDTVARIHWLGKRQLEYEAGAFYFMRLWNLPSSTQLEEQTLRKFSTALWQALQNKTNSADAFGPLVLQSVFAEVLQQECYLEIRQPTNQPAEIAFAIRLDDVQAGVWKTNLAAVMQWIGSPVVSQDKWLFLTPSHTNAIELARVGKWTIVSVAQKKNSLLNEITARIQNSHVPFFPSETNNWLDADFDPTSMANAFGINLNMPKNLSRVSLAVNGDGANVITRGALTFAQPLPIELEPWNFPTNLMHGSLIDFAAIRGVQSLLASWEEAADAPIGASPNQVYFWTLPVNPFQFYFAAPAQKAEDQIDKLSNILLQKGNPWLAAHGYVSFARGTGSNGVTWGDVSSLQPFIKSSDGWIFGGLLQDTNENVNRSPASDMFQDVLSRTNLIFYDWELTGARLEPCFYLDQTARQILRRPLLPSDSAGVIWLNALTPRLGVSTTIISRTAPNQLTLFRKSTIGLTAIELQLLTDWLESPRFPNGLDPSLTQ